MYKRRNFYLILILFVLLFFLNYITFLPSQWVYYITLFFVFSIFLVFQLGVIFLQKVSFIEKLLAFATLSFFLIYAGFGIFDAFKSFCRYSVNPINPEAQPGFVCYSPDYNLSLYGIEKLHPFDSYKYGRIYKRLLEEGVLQKEDFIQPVAISQQELLSVHSKEYLNSLNAFTVTKCFELPILMLFPLSSIQENAMYPHKLATGGTLLAARTALNRGFAINLSGGYHHAHTDHGHGFCLFADIPIAISILKKEGKINRALVIDTDTHHGDGNAVFANEIDYVDVLDMYEKDNFPSDKYPAKYDGGLEANEKSFRTYINLLSKLLEQAGKVKYDIVFFNQGSDTGLGDPLGGFHFSMKQFIQKDKLVYEFVKKHKAPVVIVLSGGYGDVSWEYHYLSMKYFLQNCQQ